MINSWWPSCATDTATYWTNNSLLSIEPMGTNFISSGKYTGKCRRLGAFFKPQCVNILSLYYMVSPHKRPVTQKTFPCHDVLIYSIDPPIQTCTHSKHTPLSKQPARANVGTNVSPTWIFSNRWCNDGPTSVCNVGSMLAQHWHANVGLIDKSMLAQCWCADVGQHWCANVGPICKGWNWAPPKKQ